MLGYCHSSLMVKQRCGEENRRLETISKQVRIFKIMKEEFGTTWEVSLCCGEVLKSHRTKLILIKVLPSTTSLRMGSNMTDIYMEDFQDLLISQEMLAAPRI